MDLQRKWKEVALDCPVMMGFGLKRWNLDCFKNSNIKVLNKSTSNNSTSSGNSFDCTCFKLIVFLSMQI